MIDARFFNILFLVFGVKVTYSKDTTTLYNKTDNQKKKRHTHKNKKNKKNKQTDKLPAHGGLSM